MYKFTESQRINTTICPEEVARKVQIVVDEAVKLGVYNKFEVDWNEWIIIVKIVRFSKRMKTYKLAFPRTASTSEVQQLAENTLTYHPFLHKEK